MYFKISGVLKGVTDYDFTFLTLVCNVAVKHLQSYCKVAQSSMQREILSFTEFLVDHPFKVNILDEWGSDDKKFEKVCKLEIMRICAF